MNTSHDPLVILIGGIDPTGGAGLARDLVTATQSAASAAPVCTAVTIQDARGVREVHPVGPDVVARQLRVAAERGAHAVKLGMLATPEIIRALVPILADLSVPVVLDPVMRASAGGSLLGEGGIEALAELKGVVTVITPNQDEAVALGSPMPRGLVEAGWSRCIITGGDGDGPDASDLYAGPEGEECLVAPRVAGRSPRGTGCAFATALAVGLATGLEPREAARAAKGAITRAIAAASDGMLGPMRAPGVWPHAGHPFE